jgi:nicotinate dehydrogenase subunit B
MKVNPSINRRDLLKGGASLLVTVSTAGVLNSSVINNAVSKEATTKLRTTAPDQLDAWLAINKIGDVSAFFGKTDMAQGVGTAMAQIVAEELDVSVNKVTTILGDTNLTPDQGGSSASSACRWGAQPLRNAAAEARQILIDRASKILGQTNEKLDVKNGSIFVKDSPETKISYGELVSEEGFGTQLDWNKKYGNALRTSGTASVKDPADYTVVGQSVVRKDIPGKILGTTEYCHHVSLPGMLHGRMIRPPVANAIPVSTNTKSIADIAGARVVHKRNLLAVVADTEWGAIQAARQLEVEWTDTDAPFPHMDQLYDYIRQAPPVVSNGQTMTFGSKNYNVPRGQKEYDLGPTNQVLASAARVVEAEYEIPFQSHARMAPSVAVADVSDNGVVIYTDAQKPHDVRAGVSKMLLLEQEQVHVIWLPGPGSYGRSDGDEAAFEAAVISREIGQPVRVQWMRDEGHGWDPKAPAAVISLKAGIDDNGDLNAWLFHAKGFSGWDVKNNPSNPGDTLAGMQLGWQKWDEHNFGTPEESYEFPNQVEYWQTIEAFQEVASPLRCAHMRSPQKKQVSFAHESFIDEAAAAIDQDPIEFRLKYLKEKREIEVMEAVATAANWETRPSPSNDIDSGDLLKGRGVALFSGYGTFVATACEVEVDRISGRIWARRFIIAHDCGLIINPLGLRGAIEGNVIQGVSRALCEEVLFDQENVRSTDWISYPILDSMDVPEAIDIVLINRPDKSPGGAGEPAHVAIAAAIGNAVFDATGFRARQMPLTPERIKAGLAT